MGLLSRIECDQRSRVSQTSRDVVHACVPHDEMYDCLVFVVDGAVRV